MHGYGLGVDDVYVFLDAFKQSRNAPSLEQAFGAAFTRSARAMFVTSFTTALAFLANMVSSIPVIFSFAVFMATLVIVNYVFTITIFVAMTSVWYQYIRDKEALLWAAVKENFQCVAKCSEFCAVKSDMRDPTLAMGPSQAAQVGVEVGVGEFVGTQTSQMVDFATLEDAFITIGDNGRSRTTETGISSSGVRQRTATANNSNVVGARSVEQRILVQLKKSNVTFESLRSSERWFLFSFGPFLVRHRRNVLSLIGGVVLLNMVLAAQLTPSQVMRA